MTADIIGSMREQPDWSKAIQSLGYKGPVLLPLKSPTKLHLSSARHNLDPKSR